jgi:hypothetical protein
VFFDFLKAFIILSLIIGTQNGTSLFSKTKKFHNFDYLTFNFKPINQIELFVGPYYANKALTTSYNQVGILTGINIEIIPKQLDLNLSYVSGHTNVSGAMTQLLYRPFKKVQLYGGVGVPEKQSGNEFFGIFGINYTF